MFVTNCKNLPDFTNKDIEFYTKSSIFCFKFKQKEHNLAKAAFAAETFKLQPGMKLLFQGAPRFHEFVLQTTEAPTLWGPRLREEKIAGGVELARWYPELGNATLWCVTELITRQHIEAVSRVLAAGLVEA